MIDHLRADEVADALEIVEESLSEDGIFVCIVTNYLGEDFERHTPNLTHTTLFNELSLRQACERAGLSVDFLKTNGKRVDERDRGRDTSSSSAQEAFKKVKPYLPTAVSDGIRSLYYQFSVDETIEYDDLGTVLRVMNSQDYFLYGGDRRHLVAICSVDER